MIALLGDIHGDAKALENACARAYAEGAKALVQVGDFGWWPHLKERLIAAAYRSPIPIYFIDGNHEYFPYLTKLWGGMQLVGSNVAPVAKGVKLYYVRRGSVVRIEGRAIAFLGGAGSIDYKTLTLGEDWFLEEQITDQDVARLEGMGPVDFMVSHCPPQSIVTEHFDKYVLDALATRQKYGAPLNWRDPSAEQVERAWAGLGYPPLYCGHMHRSLRTERVQLLGIAELVLV